MAILIREHHVDSLESHHITVFAGDARDQNAVSQAASGCDAIVHCAAMVGADIYARYPVETMETEIDSLRAVCHAALATGNCKVLYPSTSAVYGGDWNVAAYREDVTIVASSNYAIAKRFNELFLYAQYLENSLESVSFRIFNVYGPEQDKRLVIPRFIENGLKGEPLCVYGDGEHQRDFVYIDDVTQAIECGLAKVGGAEIVNVSSGKGMSIGDLARSIVQATGNHSEIRFLALPDERTSFEVVRCVGSSEKLTRMTGWVPSTSFEQGLRMTVESLRS